jgi:hypothetical protein
MNRDEFEVFEAELQRLKPKTPPQQFVQRLALRVPKSRQEPRAAAGQVMQIFNLLKRRFSTCWRSDSIDRSADYKSAIGQIENLHYKQLLRWLAPTTVVVAIAMGLWFNQPDKAAKPTRLQPGAQSQPALKPNDLEIDRQLLASFDAVARLPGGEPVRFRCREWMDQVVVRDSSRGVVIEERKPRLEIVPVGFETY